MKNFYIETDKLTNDSRKLKLYYVENDDKVVTFIKVVDSTTGEELSADELKSKSLTSALNFTTAYKGSYDKVYF